LEAVKLIPSKYIGSTPAPKLLKKKKRRGGFCRRTGRFGWEYV